MSVNPMTVMGAPVNNPVETFNTKTLAKRWSCSEQHIRNLVKRNGLPHFRLGTLLRFKLSQIEEYERCQISKSSNIVGNGLIASQTPTASAAGILLARQTLRTLNEN